MRREQLTPKQYEALHAKIRPMKAYFARVLKRMYKRGFSRDDALMQKVFAAPAAIHDLEVHCQYGSCGPPGLSPLRPRDDR